MAAEAIRGEERSAEEDDAASSDWVRDGTFLPDTRPAGSPQRRSRPARAATDGTVLVTGKVGGSIMDYADPGLRVEASLTTAELLRTEAQGTTRNGQLRVLTNFSGRPSGQADDPQRSSRRRRQQEYRHANGDAVLGRTSTGWAAPRPHNG